jgi:hypothetical protein
MNVDDSIIQKFQLNCVCGLYTQVAALSLAEAKSKLRAKGCRVIGPAHDQRLACARCSGKEEAHAA